MSAMDPRRAIPKTRESYMKDNKIIEGEYVDVTAAGDVNLLENENAKRDD